MAVQSEIEKEFKRLHNLHRHDDVSDEELYRQAKLIIKKREIDISSRFSDTKDKKQAKKLFDTYIDTYELESMSEFGSLADLVVEEINKNKLQLRLQEWYENNKDIKKNLYPPESLQKQIHNAENQILALKKRLGIDKDEDKANDLSKLEILRKRFEKHINSSLSTKHEFTTWCKHCAKPLLLHRRVKDFECFKHPHFSGRFLYNEHALQLVKDNKITKKDYAEIFKTSVAYVDYCLKFENEIKVE